MLWIENDIWYLFYELNGDQGIWLATSTDGKVWTNIRDDPVITRGPQLYDRGAVALNQIIKYKGKYYAYYHAIAEDPKPLNNWTTNVTVSKDLVRWNKYPHNPILADNQSSSILVPDGDRYRLYIMHPEVRLFFPE